MLEITDSIAIPHSEIELSAMRSQGAGGQHVNKTSTAIHLRFDIHASSLPEPVKGRLLSSRDRRITAEGVIVIKSQQHRSQKKNRDAALERLRKLIQGALKTRKKRKSTRPTRASREKRLDLKKQRGKTKKNRRQVREPDK